VTGVLWSILETLKQEVRGGCRKLHINEFHNFALVISNYWNDQFEKDEIDGVCHASDRPEMHTIYELGSLKGRHLSNGPVVGYLNGIQERTSVSTGWIHMSRDRDQWQAEVTTAMNILIP
jgi:hypothetical protein